MIRIEINNFRIEMISLHNTRRYIYIYTRGIDASHRDSYIYPELCDALCPSVGKLESEFHGGEKQRLSKLHVSQRRITSPSVCIEACFDSFSSARIRTAYLRTCTDARTRASRIRSVD